MIYLIGGAPRVGKSIIATAIAEATQARLVSTDEICGRVAEALPEEERGKKFALPPFSGTPSENTLSPQERVKLQIISAESLGDKIERIVSDTIEKQESIAIEGVHLLPKQVKNLIEKYSDIKAIFIGSQNVDLIVDGILKNTNPDNWMRNSDPAVIRQVAEFAAAFSEYIQKEAESYQLPYIERTEDFEGDVSEITADIIKPL